MRSSHRSIRRNRLHGPIPIDSDTGLYSRNFFFHRLKEERERSKRLDQPFCLLTINLGGLSMNLDPKARGKQKRRLESQLAARLVRQARIIDIAGWLDLDTIGILMPGMQDAGAAKVQEKYLGAIRETWPGTETLPLLNFFRIFSYGGRDATRNDLPPGDEPGRGTGEESVYADVLYRTSVFSVAGGVKRSLDIVGALAALLIAWLPMLVVSVLIKLSSPGPVLFRQKRVGLMGRTFTFLKFRSMRDHADETIHKNYVTQFIHGKNDKVNNGSEESPLYKIKQDPRVTRVGHFLRKTSLDELPQLFNVLKGDMSLVGPRPPIPYETEAYRPWHRARILEARPGITGLWQVTRRSHASFDEMVRLDLRYVNNWSIWLDIKILFKTFAAVVTADGAH